MDVLYEESAVNANKQKGEKRYKIISIITMILGILSIILLIMFVSNVFNFFMVKKTTPSAEDVELYKEGLAYVTGNMFVFGFLTFFFGSTWFFLRQVKKRINVSYDYTFVSGELRIAKVFNVNRRKFLYRISPENVLQVGDMDSDSYERLRLDPGIKQIVCTPNYTPQEGKFFLYIQTAENTGRKLYLLECREEMLVNILRFVKRGTLATDYVSQDKKNK